MEPKLMDFIQYGFYALMSLVATYGVTVLTAMNNSIDKLNTQVAQIMENNRWFEKELKRLEDRIEACEDQH